MIKILFEYPQLNCGGTEMVMLNLVKFFDKNLCHVDLLVRKRGNNENAFIELGCKIYRLEYTKKRKYRQDLVSFLQSHRYDVVHTHMHSDMGLVMKSAKVVGVPVRVAHSHNARIDIPRVLWPLQIIRNWEVEKNANLFFACSRIAAEWMFPRHKKTSHIVYNAINLDLFSFEESVRKKQRNKLNIDDKTKVIINVGRCTIQKNQSFILDRAKDLQAENMLFLVIGNGPLFNYIQQRIQKENITNVQLLGERTDVSIWLCAADIFMFPSIYEGLGIVAIEAQASGLRVLCSDTIPPEADMNMGNMEFISLSEIKKWEDCLKGECYSKEKRRQFSQKALLSNYNIQIEAQNVLSYYKQLLK